VENVRKSAASSFGEPLGTPSMRQLAKIRISASGEQVCGCNCHAVAWQKVPSKSKNVTCRTILAISFVAAESTFKYIQGEIS